MRKTKFLLGALSLLLAGALIFTGCHREPAQVYTVTFETNGGSEVEAASVTEGTTVTLPANPTKEGYTFDGWYTDEALTTAFDSSTLVTGDMTLYAKWADPIYTITFNPNYEGASNTQVKAKKDAEYKVTAPEVERTGYTLAGWYETEACDGDAVDLTTKTFSANATLYAKWTINKYKITFESNGGSAVDAVEADYNTSATEPTDPTKDGVYFAGWYSDKELTTEYDFKKEVLTADITLYAKWLESPVYKITIDPNYKDDEDKAVDTSSKYANAEGSYKITVDDPEREGYTFNGWYETAACDGTKVDLSTKVFDAAATLYAGWTIKTYTVTFKSADGTEIPAVTVSYKGTVTVPTTALTGSIDGYTADDKWYLNGKEVDFTTQEITKDVTIYAGWKYNTPVTITTGAEAIEVNKNGSALTVATSLADDFKILAGGVYTVKLSGYSKYAFKDLKISIVSNAIDTLHDAYGETVSAWGFVNLTNSTVLVESAEAKGTVDVSVDLVAIADAEGTGKDSHKVNLSCVDDTNNVCIYDTLAHLEEDAYLGTAYTAEMAFSTPAKIGFNANGNNYQSTSCAAFTSGITTTTMLKKRDTITLKVEGSVDIAVKNLKLQIVDTTKEGGWWTTLTDAVTIAESLDAKSDFSAELELTVKAAQVGTTDSGHCIVVMCELEEGATAESNNPPKIYEKGHDFDAAVLVTKTTINKPTDLTGVDAYSGCLMVTLDDYLPTGKAKTDYDYVVLNVTFKDADGNEVTYSDSSATGQVVLLGDGDWNSIGGVYNVNSISSDYYSVYIPVSSDLVKLALQNSGTNCASMTINYIDWYSTGVTGITAYSSADDAIAAAIADKTKTLVVGYTMGIAGRSGWGIGGLVDSSWASVNAVSAGSYTDCGEVMTFEFAGTDIDSTAKKCNLYNGAAFLFCYLK